MMVRKLYQLFAVLLGVAVLATACGGSDTDEASDTATEAASESGAAGEDSATTATAVDIEALEGDTMLWFWAPW